MSTAAQRKAWNEAMRSAAGGVASSTMLPKALQPPAAGGRRSDRRKKQDRRDKARKSLVDVTDDSADAIAYRAAIWMDALEDVPASGVDGDDHDGKTGDDDEYDEFEDLDLDDDDDDDDGSSKKRKRGAKSSKRKSGGGQGSGSKRKSKGGGGTNTPGTLPKRFKIRSLASILLEEVNRPDGVAYEWLNQEARTVVKAPHLSQTPSKAANTTSSAADMDDVDMDMIDTTTNKPNNDDQRKSVSNVLGRSRSSNTGGGYEQLPRRKFCPVTGQEGLYREPKTGIPYANIKALEQIRERPPPWMSLSGTAAYHEAVKSIRDE